MEEEDVGESWNKKRIAIAVFLLGVFVVGGYFLKTNVFISPSHDTREVKGISAEDDVVINEPKIDVQAAASEKINDLKKEVSNLDVMEIASSSPQVQKILNDIKSLEKYPATQAKQVCNQICDFIK